MSICQNLQAPTPQLPLQTEVLQDWFGWLPPMTRVVAAGVCKEWYLGVVTVALGSAGESISSFRQLQESDLTKQRTRGIQEGLLPARGVVQICGLDKRPEY